MFRAVLAFLALSLLIALVPPASAGAEEIITLGHFNDWTAYQTTQGGKKLCYMASEPIKTSGKYKKRGRIYAMVSHRPATKAFNVVSIHAGYKYKEDSSVFVKIGGKTFELFTHGDTAWALDAAGDRALVRAMKKGSKMIVRGESWRGTKTVDTFSLLGFTAAHRVMDKACGVR